MMSSCVMVVEIIQKIDFSIEFVEEAAGKSKTLVEEFDWRNHRRAKDVFQPCQPRICNRNPKQENQVSDLALGCAEFSSQALEDQVVGLRIVYLLSRPLRAGIYATECHVLAQPHIKTSRM